MINEHLPTGFYNLPTGFYNAHPSEAARAMVMLADALGSDLCVTACTGSANSTDRCISKPHDDEDEEDREGNTEKTITLLNGQGFVTQCKWAKVIRYCNFSILKDMKEHYREQLMLFHPWRDEQKGVGGSTSKQNLIYL
ncbi:hypothetical protein ACOMHN_017832 [Nucella lapillus]